jgi:hypothetical protein
MLSRVMPTTTSTAKIVIHASRPPAKVSLA